MHVVVKVLKFHGATLEWIFLITALILLSLASRYYDKLFQEVSRGNNSVGVQLTVVFDLLNSIKLIITVLLRPNVRVSRALFNRVARFFAAQASDVVYGLLLLFFAIQVLFVLL